MRWPWPACGFVAIGRRAGSFVFQVLPHTLGLPPTTWRVLSKGHEARNVAEYEGAIDLDERLVDDLIGAARAVLDALRAAGLPPGV